MNDSIHIKDLIGQLIDTQRRVISSLEDGLDERYEDQDILNYLTKARKDSVLSNSALTTKVADYCQLLDNEEDLISLEQIEQLYRAALQIHPLDLGMYESLARYLDSVQDQPEQARSILNSGIDRVEKKIAELKELIKTFE
jgi:hypothetical protein